MYPAHHYNVSLVGDFEYVFFVCRRAGVAGCCLFGKEEEGSGKGVS